MLLMMLLILNGKETSFILMIWHAGKRGERNLSLPPLGFSNAQLKLNTTLTGNRTNSSFDEWGKTMWHNLILHARHSQTSKLHYKYTYFYKAHVYDPVHKRSNASKVSDILVLICCSNCLNTAECWPSHENNANKQCCLIIITIIIICNCAGFDMFSSLFFSWFKNCKCPFFPPINIIIIKLIATSVHSLSSSEHQPNDL